MANHPPIAPPMRGGRFWDRECLQKGEKKHTYPPVPI